MLALVTTAGQEDVQPKLFVDLRVACENTRFSSLFAASDYNAQNIMHFALNSFFRPIFGLHRKRM